MHDLFCNFAVLVVDDLVDVVLVLIVLAGLYAPELPPLPLGLPHPERLPLCYLLMNLDHRLLFIKWLLWLGLLWELSCENRYDLLIEVTILITLGLELG